MKGIRRLLIGLLLACMALSLFATPVFAAIAQPDSIAIDGVWAFHNLAETGDMEFIVAFNDYYSGAVPTELASETMIIRLMSGITELGNASPYPYGSINGYQKGIVGMYFTAAQVTAKGMVWGSAYTVSFTGNPLLTWAAPATPPNTTTGITEWNTDTDQQQALGDRVIVQGLLLESAWALDLVEMVNLTNFITRDYGQAYFPSAIPNLEILAPQIFQAQSEQPVYKTELPDTSAYAPDEMPGDVTSTAVAFGMSNGALKSLLTFIAVFAFLLFFASRVPNGGRYAILIAGAFIIFFTRMGAVVPVWASVLMVICLLIIGYLLFYEKSTV